MNLATAGKDVGQRLKGSGSGRNILILADKALPDGAGGGQTMAWELAKGLLERDFRITILTPARPSSRPRFEMVDGVRVARYSGAGSFSGMVSSGRRAAFEVMASQMPLLVHSHFAYAEVGPQMALPKTLPRVRSFHGPWHEEGWAEETRGLPGLWWRARCKQWLRRRIEKWSLRRARRVVVMSDYMWNTALALGINPQRLRMVTGASDVARFHPDTGRRQARERLGWDDAAPLLVTVRRLVPRMGLEALVRAMPEVLQGAPGARLVIGGRGPEESRLTSLIHGLGLQQKVTMAGFVPEDQLADYYRAADLFVLPTLSLEGFGLVTVDALACGTPVLGTPAGATPEILGPLDRRLVTAGTRSEDLAQGILEFWKGGWRSDLTSDRLHAYVRERYTWDQHLVKMLGVYEEALHES